MVYLQTNIENFITKNMNRIFLDPLVIGVENILKVQ